MPYQDIQANELETLLQREDLVIIDMRDATSKIAGQLPNARPADDTLVSALAKRRHQAPPVLVYCYHGNRSRDLCSLLTQFGLPEVYNLAGGWAAWEIQQSVAGTKNNEQQQWLSDNRTTGGHAVGRRGRRGFQYPHTRRQRYPG